MGKQSRESRLGPWMALAARICVHACREPGGIHECICNHPSPASPSVRHLLEHIFVLVVREIDIRTRWRRVLVLMHAEVHIAQCHS
jgi:hypothetical protein